MNDISSSNIEFFAVVHQLLFVIFLWIADTALFNNVFKYFLKEYFMFLRHISQISLYTRLGLKMFAQGGLYMRQNAYVPEGKNQGGRVATPTSFSISASYDMKSLWFKFGHDIFTGFKVLKVGIAYVSAVLWK